MRAKALPKRLFVVQVETVDQSEYLSAQRSIEEAFEASERDYSTLVGEYKLVALKRATKRIEVTP